MAISSFELDDLLVVVGVAVAEDVATEHQPGGEAVERLDLIHHRRDALPQLRFGQVTQQDQGAHRTAEFAKRPVQPVLAGVMAEPAQQRHRRQRGGHGGSSPSTGCGSR
nr:hypothetical protein [Parafrankia sp. BMG5.11]